MRSGEYPAPWGGDLSVWRWESKDGNRAVTVTPSVQGRATQFDKDVLIYVVSQMTEALNRERLDAKNRVVRFTVYDYLVSTNKPTGGKEYQRIEAAFQRLRGTTIETNIKTGGQRVKEGFGLIERWKIVERSREDEGMVAVEVTLSEWLFNAVQAHEVLTIHSNYFRLRKPLERRLYELARKHCGRQVAWMLELLREKCGAQVQVQVQVQPQFAQVRGAVARPSAAVHAGELLGAKPCQLIDQHRCLHAVR